MKEKEKQIGNLKFSEIYGEFGNCDSEGTLISRACPTTVGTNEKERRMDTVEFASGCPWPWSPSFQDC